MYSVATYAIPLAIGIATLISLISWPSQYAATEATPLPFQVLESTDPSLPLAQVVQHLSPARSLQEYDSKLSENPFWLYFNARQSSQDGHTAIEFPSRHASSIVCWDAATFGELGRADHRQTSGAFSSVKAGFALGLHQQLSLEWVICQASFIGPAKIRIIAWPATGLQHSTDQFYRNCGLLEGGMIVLAMFMFVTALINRSSSYVLFGAWLIANLRVGALSAGWDFQWLGHTVPLDLLHRLRLVTIAAYYVLTAALFGTLFHDDLLRVGYRSLIHLIQWSCIVILPLSFILPFAFFLPLFWLAVGAGVAVLVFFLARILMVSRSPVAIWYSASLAVTLAASVYEVFSAALGLNGFIGTFNSVTAALSSSLLASLAIASQMRAEHTERLEAQAELRHNYEAMPIGLFTLDMQGRFLNANPALKTMLGQDVLQRGHNLWKQYFHPDAWSVLLDKADRQTGTEIELKSDKAARDAEQKIFLARAILSRGKIEGWLQDVTEKTRATEELRFLAMHDPLTKAYNRRGIQNAYENALNHLANGRPFALGYLDLDRFKLINVLYGHTTGDEVLRQVCDRIASMLSARQHIGRIGGDEFVIMMPDMMMAPAMSICRGIIDKVCTEPFRIADKAFQVGISIGLIEIRSETLFKDALANADRACREAKQGHSNRLVAYEKNARAFQEREEELALVGRMTADDPIEGLFLVMQPIMSLKAPYGAHNFEVLIRMRNKAGEVVPANRIIAAAESCGRTAMIDRWVLASTLAWLDEHQDHLFNTRFVCMNLSGASLNDERFIADAYAMLADNLRPAGLLCLEITENVALHDLQNTRRFIDRVRSYGVKVALDDFGAGYTSFSYLKELPADVLKIDGSFIVNLNEHPTNISIVETIVNLAMNLGMQTIAEWAEDNETVQTLAEIGVDYVQGFAIARPQLPERMLECDSSAQFIEDPELKRFVNQLNMPRIEPVQQDLLEQLLDKKYH